MHRCGDKITSQKDDTVCVRLTARGSVCACACVSCVLLGLGALLSILSISSSSLISAFIEEHRKHPLFVVCLMSGECKKLLNVLAGPE